MWNVSAKRWKFCRNTFYWFYPKTRLCDTFLFRITLNRRLKVMVQATLLSNSRRYIKIFIEMCFYFLRTVLYITLCGCQIHTWWDNVQFISCVYNIKPFCKKKKYLKIDFDYDSVLRSYFCAGFWIWMKSLKGKNLYWSVFLTNNNKRRKNAYSVVGVVAFNVFFFLSPYSKSQTQAISLRKNLIKSIFLVNLLEIVRLIRTPN